MGPTIHSVKYVGNTVKAQDVHNRLLTAIREKTKFEVSDANLGTSTSAQVVKACTIEYDTGDGQRKRRTLEQGRSFHFGNDIESIIYQNQIDDPKVFERIFAFMDTTDRFLVEERLFWDNPPGEGGINCVDMRYVLPDTTTREQVVDEKKDFIFNKGKIVKGSPKPEPKPDPKPDPTPAPKPDPKPEPKPDPKPKPGTCLCPCPVCAANHKTPEQRRAEEEKKAREEQERQKELEDLRNAGDAARKAAEEAKKAADDAKKAAEDAKKAADSVRHDLKDKLKEIERLRVEIIQIRKDVDGAKKDAEQARREVEDVRKELDDLWREVRNGGSWLGGGPPIFKLFWTGSQFFALFILFLEVYKLTTNDRH